MTRKEKRAVICVHRMNHAVTSSVCWHWCYMNRLVFGL